MNRLILMLTALAAVAMDVRASAGDSWTLNIDSIATKSKFGVQAFANRSSRVSTQVSTGVVSLVASKITSEGNEGYSADIGLVVALKPDGFAHDLTGLTSITFEYQNDTRITDVLSIRLGSRVDSASNVNAAEAYSSDLADSSMLLAGTAWKQAEVSIDQFTRSVGGTGNSKERPSIAAVLQHMTSLQFVPRTRYTAPGWQLGKLRRRWFSTTEEPTLKACSKCVAPTMPHLTLKIRNIVLHGVKEPAWPNPNNIGCEDTQPFWPLSDFEAGSKNFLGDDFFTISDFDTLGNSSNPARGSSVVTDSIHSDGPYMVMNAKLNKKDGSTYHKDAGWADITTNFHNGGALEATGLTAIGFFLADLGINAKRIQNITFKIKMKGMSDTALHQVELPLADIAASGLAGKIACIRPVDLIQPSQVSSSQKVPFNPSKILQLYWEAKISDDMNPNIDTATANLVLANVILYYSDAVRIDQPIRVSQLHGVSTPSVVYANGSLRLKGFANANRFEVRDLGGKVVASFVAASQVSIALPRGAYLLSAIGSGAPTTTKFSVLDR